MILTLIWQFEIFSTGSNAKGKLGQGIDPKDDTLTKGFEKIELKDDVSKFNIGSNHVVAVSTKGQLYAWGANDYNELLVSGQSYWTTPTVIKYFKDKKLEVVDADSGAQHTIVLTDDGAVYTFGSNSYGQLGTSKANVSQTKETPVKIELDPKSCVPVGVSAELYTSYIICSSGAVLVFGSCQSYKCGDSVIESTNFDAPQRMNVTFRITSIISGNETAFAIDTDGYVWAIGRNTYGQLCMDSNKMDVSVFTRIDSLRNVKSISVGKRHTIIIVGQDLYGCGSNNGNEFSADAKNEYKRPTLSTTGIETATATTMGTIIVRDGNMSAIGESSAENPELGAEGVLRDWTDVPQAQLVRYVIGFGDYSFAFEEYSEQIHSLNGWAITGIILAVLVIVAGAGVAVWWFCFKNRNAFKKSYNEVNVNLAAEAESW